MKLGKSRHNRLCGRRNGVMDIFKLGGDKILALLEAVFGFWNNQISLIFDLLGQSPDAFKGGGPWNVIAGIEPIFVAVGSSPYALTLRKT